MMKPMLWVCLILTMSPFAAEAQEGAQEVTTAVLNSAMPKATVDPSGTWAWEQSFGGNLISRELRLQFLAGQLVGTLKSVFPPGATFRRGSNDPDEIRNVKFEGDELTFDVTRKFGDREFKTSYACVIVDDDLAGFSRVDFGGQVRETEWIAKRVTQLEQRSSDAAVSAMATINQSSAAVERLPEDSDPLPAVAPVHPIDNGVPAPGPEGDGPYQPQPILPGGLVVPLYPADSPLLNQGRVRQSERYSMTANVPGRIQSIVNIHNPSIEVHRVSRSTNTGAVIIVAAGGGHRTLNVGTESADFVPYFFNYGVNTVILRNRLRSDGYEPEKDAVNDAMQAIRMVRKYAKQWQFDPDKIGIMGFSAGAELAAPAAVLFDQFDREHNDASDPLAGISSRPDFVGIIYPGPTPFTRDRQTPVAVNAPPAFITCAGAGDRIHAIWADDYFRAMLDASIPNVEMHIYGNGFHPGTRGATGGLTHRNGIPFGKWQERFMEWFNDLGFLNEPGVETKAAIDVREFSKRERALNE